MGRGRDDARGAAHEPVREASVRAPMPEGCLRLATQASGVGHRDVDAKTRTQPIALASPRDSHDLFGARGGQPDELRTQPQGCISPGWEVIE
jgi:hypothetical protein